MNLRVCRYFTRLLPKAKCYGLFHPPLPTPSTAILYVSSFYSDLCCFFGRCLRFVIENYKQQADLSLHFLNSLHLMLRCCKSRPNDLFMIDLISEPFAVYKTVNVFSACGRMHNSHANFIESLPLE